MKFLLLLYNFFLYLTLISQVCTSYYYDYTNILEKSPKTDITFIFDSDDSTKNNFQIKSLDTSFNALFFHYFPSVIPLYDKTMYCYYPNKKAVQLNDDIYINKNFFTNTTKIKIIPKEYGQIFLSPLTKVCYNVNIDKWYYKLCPFVKAVQILSTPKVDKKTGVTTKEINNIGYAINSTVPFNEIQFFFKESNVKISNQLDYILMDETEIIGIYQNLIKIYSSPKNNKNEYSKINENKTTIDNGTTVIFDTPLDKYKAKILLVEYKTSELMKNPNYDKYRVNNNYRNITEYNKANWRKGTVTFERNIIKIIDKNLILLNEELPAINRGTVKTKILVKDHDQENFYNKEFFVEDNYLYCSNCNLLKCKIKNNCVVTVSNDSGTKKYYYVKEIIDEKLVMLNSVVNKQNIKTSKFALFFVENNIFYFGKGKVGGIKIIKTELEIKYILYGYGLDLKENEEVLLNLGRKDFYNQENNLYIIKDIDNNKKHLIGIIKNKINETDYEILLKSIDESKYTNEKKIPLEDIFFIINEHKVSDIPKMSNGGIYFKTNTLNSFGNSTLFDVNQLSKLTIKTNQKIIIPYKIPYNNARQIIFHFKLKKFSALKNSYVTLCFSKNELCTEDDFEMIIHSKNGILLFYPKNSTNHIIQNDLSYYTNEYFNFFNEEIVCDIILMDSTIYLNSMDKEYSSIKLKYKFENEKEFNKIKYININQERSINIKLKEIYFSSFLSYKLYANVFFYDKKYLLDDKAVFMEKFENGDYCPPPINKKRSVIVYYKCDDDEFNNLKIMKVSEDPKRLCEYIYYVKSRFLCNPNNIIRNQIKYAKTNSFCYSDNGENDNK